MSRIAVVSLGCAKNAVDSEALSGMLSAGGHALTHDPADADVVLVNTCGFIDPARRETVDEVLDLARLKDDGLKGLIVTGCLVARSAQELAEALPEVDALVDFAAYPRIPEIVTDVIQGSLDERVQGHPGTRFDPAYWDAAIAAAPRLRFGRAPWAYVKIAEGCDRGCAFCAIPLMRGKFVSRPAAAIATEVRHLVASGVTEVSLVSQDSVMWGRDTGEGDLPQLLRALERIDGVRRLRLMYLHPRGLTDELMDTVLASNVVTHYFDLSLQHVAPSVLKGMGRWGGRARFDAIIDRIRTGDADAAIRSTFILGFPGETEGDADEVEEFVADRDLDWVGTFTYSREEGTRSFDMSDHVEADVARARAERVERAAQETMARRAQSFVGRTLEVLAERFDRDEQRWVGRSAREAPEVDGEIAFTAPTTTSVGDYLPVAIERAVGTDLSGVAREPV